MQHQLILLGLTVLAVSTAASSSGGSVGSVLRAATRDANGYLEYNNILDVDHLDNNKQRRSWKEEPKSGKCMDHEQGSVYTCNLVEILE